MFEKIGDELVCLSLTIYQSLDIIPQHCLNRLPLPFKPAKHDSIPIPSVIAYVHAFGFLVICVHFRAFGLFFGLLFHDPIVLLTIYQDQSSLSASCVDSIDQHEFFWTSLLATVLGSAES